MRLQDKVRQEKSKGVRKARRQWRSLAEQGGNVAFMDDFRP